MASLSELVRTRSRLGGPATIHLQHGCAAGVTNVFLAVGRDLAPDNSNVLAFEQIAGPNDGEDRIVIEQALVSAVARLARDLGCSWTIWKDIPSAETSLLQAAAASKFFPVPALPDTRIALGAGLYSAPMLPA